MTHPNQVRKDDNSSVILDQQSAVVASTKFRRVNAKSPATAPGTSRKESPNQDQNKL